MPSFAWRLGDAQAAAVVTYIRNAWGNAAAAVSPDQIRTGRGKRGTLIDCIRALIRVFRTST
jgi:mono/diheme cytochrome c family protein